MQTTSSPAPAEAGGGGSRKTLAVLRQRNYRWFFISGMGMTAGEGIQQLAVAWLVLDITGSVGQLGLTFFARGITWTVLGLFGGVLADRYDKRNLLLANQAVTALNLLVLSGLTISGGVAVWHVYVSSILLGATSSLSSPARNAIIRNLVHGEDMLNAVALNSIQMNISRIVWPTLAGLVIASIGSEGALFFAVICYVVGFVCMIPVPGEAGTLARGGASALTQLVEGLSYTFATPVLAVAITLVVSMGMFGLSFNNIAPAYAREVMHFGPATTGFFLMAAGIGSIAGSVAILVLAPGNRLFVMVVLSLAFAGSLIGLALSPWPTSAFLLMGVFGLANTTLAVVAQTIFQLIVPAQFIGRVMSLFMMAPGIAALLTLPIGLIAELAGLRVAVAGIGVILLAVSLVLGVARLPGMQSQVKALETDEATGPA